MMWLWPPGKASVKGNSVTPVKLDLSAVSTTTRLGLFNTETAALAAVGLLGAASAFRRRSF